jgi:hypothetical protein
MSQIANDFSLVLGGSEHAYTDISAQSKDSHAHLASISPRSLHQTLGDSVLRRLDEMLAMMMPVHDRIARRDVLFTDLSYYLNKCAQLDRESMAHSRALRPSDKRERNAVKLSAARIEYTTFNDALMEEMRAIWNQRVDILGPALIAQLDAEKHAAHLSSMALSQIKLGTAQPTLEAAGEKPELLRQPAMEQPPSERIKTAAAAATASHEEMKDVPMKHRSHSPMSSAAQTTQTVQAAPSTESQPHSFDESTQLHTSETGASHAPSMLTHSDERTTAGSTRSPTPTAFDTAPAGLDRVKPVQPAHVEQPFELEQKE